jgi:hypothetical protein
VHLKRTVGPIVFDAPAGAACDSAFTSTESGAESHALL